MERARNKTSVKATAAPLKVVVVENDQTHIEQQIEKHVKKIRALIKKLRPAERQKYFNGFLSHILEDTNDASVTTNKLNFDIQPTRLSFEEMKLLEELSLKMEQLYRTMDHDPS